MHDSFKDFMRYQHISDFIRMDCITMYNIVFLPLGTPHIRIYTCHFFR